MKENIIDLLNDETWVQQEFDILFQDHYSPIDSKNSQLFLLLLSCCIYNINI